MNFTPGERVKRMELESGVYGIVRWFFVGSSCMGVALNDGGSLVWPTESNFS